MNMWDWILLIKIYCIYQWYKYNPFLLFLNPDWIDKVFYNHKCFSGPYLNKGRIAELPKSVGPGMVPLVLREVLHMLINAAYKPPRVLRELQVENEETAGMKGSLQVMKAKYVIVEKM